MAVMGVSGKPTATYVPRPPRAVAGTSAERMRVEYAVEAAVATAARYGVVATRSHVLHHSNNVVVHLSPAPVVAKVATSEHRRQGAASIARELAIGHFLAGQDAPTVAPTTILPAGPHRVDGLALAFWDYCPNNADRAPELREAAESHLARLRRRHR